MHGHQLHGIVGRFFFQTNITGGFCEVIQIFDEVAQALSLALLLPILHELHEAFEIPAVGFKRKRRKFQGGNQFVQQRAGGSLARGFAEAGEKTHQLGKPRRFGCKLQFALRRVDFVAQ